MPRRFTDRDIALHRNKHGENIPVPPARKKKDNEESRIQCAVVTWWHHACAGFTLPDFVLIAIPNSGAGRGPVTGAILKREGVRAGACDLFLAVKRGNYGGLWIEMKKPDGKLSDAQNEFIAEMNHQGYAAYACYGYDEATKLITRYLKMDLFL